MKSFTARCKKISTANGLETLLVTGKSYVSRRSKSRIKVQTTSVARRQAVKKMQQRKVKVDTHKKRSKLRNFSIDFAMFATKKYLTDWCFFPSFFTGQ